jgi:hypothetical protein
MMRESASLLTPNDGKVKNGRNYRNWKCLCWFCRRNIAWDAQPRNFLTTSSQNILQHGVVVGGGISLLAAVICLLLQQFLLVEQKHCLN